MKVLAINLPQFHEIEENNEWWGKGFTEWTNIKKENKFSDKLRPYNDNYYDMLDKQTLEWQCDLATQYGIDGFCYYHYWFEGKKLLEKPVENLLKWKDIKQNFCFYWANHSWKRSWQGKSEILVEQTYGDETSWREHFDYLLPFFQDERYIKIDNKPIFIIFDPVFDEKDSIIEFFNKMAIENGFDGVFFVETINILSKIQKVSNKADAIYVREPSYSENQYIYDKKHIAERAINKVFRVINNKIKIKQLVTTYNGNKLRKNAEKAYDMLPPNNKYIYGGYTMWDNTYRHNERGYKITKPTAKMFQKHFAYILQKNEENTGITIINAWNEWCEGMILEPDADNGYFFLELIKNTLQDYRLNK